MSEKLKSYVRSEAILRRQGWSRWTLARKMKAKERPFPAPAMELDGVRYWSAVAYAAWQDEQEAASAPAGVHRRPAPHMPPTRWPPKTKAPTWRDTPGLASSVSKR